MKILIDNFGDSFTDDDWAKHLYDAYLVAKDSPDPSTQNGALLYSQGGAILAADYNRFPDGVAYLPERWERPLKYDVIEHAERNSIFWAASRGRATADSTMVAPWAACADCARAIIQAKVRRLVRHQEATEQGRKSSGQWDGSISIADQMLKEAGVEIINVSWNFADQGLSIRHSGEFWVPGGTV